MNAIDGPKTVTFVSYYNVVSGKWYSHEIDHHDPRQVVASGIVPSVFRFYDADVYRIVGTSGNVYKSYGEPNNLSPCYFTDEKLFKSLAWKDAELLTDVPARNSPGQCST